MFLTFARFHDVQLIALLLALVRFKRF